MNPSRATDHREDESWILMREFAWAWGYGGLVVVNLVPYRSPRPRDAIRILQRLRCGLHDNADLELNCARVRAVAAEAVSWVIIWGNQGAAMNAEYPCKEQLIQSLRDGVDPNTDVRFLTFGLTMYGNPMHVRAPQVSLFSPVFEYDPQSNRMGPQHVHPHALGEGVRDKSMMRLQ